MANITPKINKTIFTDDVLSVLPANNTLKRGVRNAEKGQNPEYQEKVRQSVKEQWETKDQSDRIESVRKTISNKWKDPEYQEKQKVGRADRYADPERCGNYKSPIIGTCKKTGEEKIFKGADQLRKAGFDPPNVYACLNGTRKSSKGYTWRRES